MTEKEYAEKERANIRAIGKVLGDRIAGRISPSEALRQIREIEAEDTKLREQVFKK